MIPYGYKQTEAGVIPEDWELLLLGKTAKVYRGGSPRPIQSYITNSSNGVNWIKIGDVRENDKYIYSTQEKIRPDGISMSREVHIGDFILSNSMSFGRPYILRTNGCIHDGWLTIQEYGQAFSTEYLYYLLSSKIIYKQYIGMAAGSSVKNLNKDKVSSLMVICPPLPEQQRIAEALSDVDGMISSLEKLIAKYKSIKTACLQQMFPQNGETVPRMRLPGFTGAWEQHKLGDVAKYRNGKAHENDISEQGKFIVVNSKFVSTNGEVRKFSNKQIEPLFKNEIAFVLSDVPNGRAIARTFLVDKNDKYTLNQRIAGITPIEGVCPYFLHILMNRNNYFLQFDDGAKQTNLSVTDVMEFAEYYPSSEEEQQIGMFFQQLDNLITLHQRKLEKIQKIKQGMMQQLLTGKIRLV